MAPRLLSCFLSFSISAIDALAPVASPGGLKVALSRFVS
jgi:hypothetical protein